MFKSKQKPVNYKPKLLRSHQRKTPIPHPGTAVSFHAYVSLYIKGTGDCPLMHRIGGKLYDTI